MSKTANMREAKTHLSRFVRQLRDGHAREIIIAVAGKPCARLVPYGARDKRLLGMDAGLVIMSPDFDADDAEIAAVFEGSD